jgi:hypothetical protein
MSALFLFSSTKKKGGKSWHDFEKERTKETLLPLLNFHEKPNVNTSLSVS